MYARIGVWCLTLVILLLTGAGVGSAGFFDDLVEEGKKKLKDEADKVLKPGQGQAPSPGGTRPSQGAGRTQSPSSMSNSAGLDIITEIGPPALRKVQGHTLYDVGPPGTQGGQWDRMRRWIDYLDLGLAPDLFEKNPECFLSKHVPELEWAQYVDDKIVRAVETGKRMMPGAASQVQIQKNDWKGGNEFEKARSRQAFIENYRDKFKGAAIQTPIEMVFVYPEPLKYDFESQGFPLSRSLGPAGELQSLCGGSFRPSSMPFTVRDKEFLQQVKARNKQSMGMRLWAINPDEAEKLLQRLQRADAGSGMTMGVAYWGIVAEYSTVPGTGVSQTLQNQSSITRPQIRATVKSVGLYEDPDMERPIKELGIIQSAQPVLMAGIPEAVPKVDRVLLDEETASLLTLKYHGDVLSAKDWEALARKQVEHDGYYHAFGKPSPTENEMRGASGGGGKEFDPTYVPFVWPQFPGALDAQQMALFKQWAMKRAVALPDTVVLKGGYGQFGNDKEFGFRHTNRAPSSWEKRLQESLVKLGQAPGQILTFSDQNQGRVFGVVLPNLIKSYVPQQEIEEFKRASAAAYSELEIELTVQKTQLMDVGAQEKYLALYGSPSRYRIVFNTNNERVIWRENAFQVVSLDPGQVTMSQPVVPAQSVSEAGQGGGVEFTAQVADLLVAKYLPDSLDRPTLERMLLARWFYENAVSRKKEDPEGGRFFVEGKPKPDKAQRAAILNQFKEWTLQRAKALPTKVVIQLTGVAQEAGRLLLPDGLSKKGQLSLRIQGDSCSRNRQAGCERLMDSFKIPSRYLYLANISAGRINPHAGSRSNCGIAIQPKQDHYCQGSNEAAQSDLMGEEGLTLSDVIELDKSVEIPSARKDLLAQPQLASIRLELEVTGVKKQSERPPHPAVLAYVKVTGNSNLQDWNQSGPYFIFQARLYTAQVVLSGQGIADLALQDFPVVEARP